MSEDRCICCGEIVPEGRMVCPICEKGKPRKCNHPDEAPACAFHYNGACSREHNYECPALVKPSVNVVERMRGKWIKNDFYEDALMCSCCRAYLDKEDWSRHYFYFCYHCGAFMEGMEVEQPDDPR